MRWTDPETVPLDKLQHAIHWINMEDETPILADAGKEFIVSAIFAEERICLVTKWKGDRWMGTPFVTHWAHITPPEE